MSKLILLDTNFLFGKRLEPDYLQKFIDKGIDVYISEIILDELKGQNIREIRLSYDKIKKALEDTKYPELYFNIKDNTNLDEVFVESDERMDTYFRKIFGDNVIPMPDKGKIFDILLERSKLKIPPFYDEKGASDKGFKDTLIWLDFLNFCSKNTYDEYYLISKDNGFIKYSDFIKKEFKDVVGSDSFEILQFTKLNELTSKFLEKETEPNSDIKAELPFEEEKRLGDVEIDRETLQKAKISVRNLLITQEYDNFNEYDVGNVELYQILSEENTVEFCNELSKKRDELTFFDFYDITNIFDKIFIRSKKVYEVEVSYIINFIEVWNLINSKYSKYKEAFVKFLNSELNKLVILELVNDNDEELPF